MTLKQIAESLHLEEFQGKFPYLKLEVVDGELRIGTASERRMVSISPGRERWTTATEDWHGHFDEPREAGSVAWLILASQARTCSQYRAGRHASSWLEVWDGDAFESQCKSVYLSPFDREDWKLWPGEKWVVKRIHREVISRSDWPKLGSEIGMDKWLKWDGPAEFTVESESPIGPPTDAFLNRYELEFGPANNGFRWVADCQFSFVLQVPKDWRSYE